MTEESKQDAPADVVPDKPVVPEKDPIVDNSLSWHIAIASAMLLLATAWAIYNETITLRPWKEVQIKFATNYASHLETLRGEQEEKENAVRGHAEFKQIDSELQAAEKSIAAENEAIKKEISGEINLEIAELNKELKPVKAEIGERTYTIEMTHGEARKVELRDNLDLFRKEHDVVNKMDRLLELKSRRAVLSSRQAELLGPISTLRAQRDEYMTAHLGGMTVQQVDDLLASTKNFKYGIKQIHIRQLQTRFYSSGSAIDMVDRCETCHLGVREPVTLTAANMGDQTFVSHPNPALLKIHDPEMFGCSLCHGGNGVATTSVEKGHGKYKHWLWPLHDLENVEAGCVQCHDQQIWLEHAPTLNKGRDLFSKRGCWGCHPREGFNTERSGLQNVRKELDAITQALNDYDQQERDAEAIANSRSSTSAQVKAAVKLRGELLPLWRTQLQTNRTQLLRDQHDLIQSRKKVGPNLKDIKAKLIPEFLPYWIEQPERFRPTTKMPSFRLEPKQLEAISAFLWQSAVNVKVPKRNPGDAVKGKDLFTSRGCLACHTTTLDRIKTGDGFAADLSRIGEKVNYDYLARWIHNPRERLQPYSPALGRDLTQKDYDDKGLPYTFDQDNHDCPVTGEELVYQHMTVMPNLRLTWEESEHIASFLMTMKDKKAEAFPAAPYLTDTGLFDYGQKLVKHFGCASCHEITGMEDERGIGTELTAEGSKPMERLDFGHLTHDSKRYGWHDHKGFFEQKLRKPEVFDYHKERGEFEKLRMPNFRLEESKKNNEVNALVTYLLGSVDSRIPEGYLFEPESGPDRDIIDGWWVLKKYNCIGCHQVIPGEKPSVQNLDWFKGDLVSKAPPSLVGEGFRTDPVWLSSFLADPSLGENPHGNGVRAYLDIRMPTFSLPATEVRKLARFFSAMASQISPYKASEVQPLQGADLEMARAAFQYADCIKCHATSSDPKDFKEDWIAPSFTLASKRLKGEWMQRWLQDPKQMMPGTQMPQLFKQEGGRWVLISSEAAPLPATVKQYQGDHIELLVRYLQQFDATESARYK